MRHVPPAMAEYRWHMAADGTERIGWSGPEEMLCRLSEPDPPPFAILYRPCSANGPDVLEILIGEARKGNRLADLPSADRPVDAASPHDLLAFLPYRQVRERGLDCVDDGEPIRMIVVQEQARMPLADGWALLPDLPTELRGAAFDVSDEDYRRTVQQVVDDDIGRGAGSNFVISRSLTGVIPDFTPAAALTLFRRLLARESGAYWTFVAYTGDRTFVGASPEGHVTLDRGSVAMNPISGTFRYPPGGPRVPDLLGFLADRKEADELHMVVDEELKMMARICDAGGTVTGPYLKEMSWLAHTEYLIEGRSTLEPHDVLRATLFAPTVTGSPLENACRVIARRERAARGYYSGAAALVGRDASGHAVMDSSILIRTAVVENAGRARIGTGATVVRLSDPAAEVAETWVKASSLLSAFDPCDTDALDRCGSGTATPARLSADPRVRAALLARNAGLASFWREPEHARRREVPGLQGRRALIVDAEDTFSGMLGTHLTALGMKVVVRPYDDLPDLPGWDLVVAGPGPGDPDDLSDRRVRVLSRTVAAALEQGHPLFAVCLSHQMLAASLGLPVVRRTPPNQGVQREIDLFGRTARVGFYNAFTAQSTEDKLQRPDGDVIEVSRDQRTADVHALRGERFASVQFHPESLLTRDGPEILTELVTPLIVPSARERR